MVNAFCFLPPFFAAGKNLRFAKAFAVSAKDQHRLPFDWLEVDGRPSALDAQSRVAQQQLFCAGCGAGLDDGLYDACPYCRSNIGVIDPSRLASAIDIQQAAAPTSFPTEVVGGDAAQTQTDMNAEAISSPANQLDLSVPEPKK